MFSFSWEEGGGEMGMYFNSFADGKGYACGWKAFGFEMTCGSTCK